jgi:predicted neutral ceramidase superfamily lipid hydrolase
MPPYLSNLNWLKFFWPLALLTAIATLIIWGGYLAAMRRQAKPQSILIIFGFCSLGLTVGVLTGDSGAQVISTVLPAVLSLVGGLAVYLIGKESKDSLIVAPSIAALSFTLLLGALIGANNRNTAENQYQAEVKIQESAQKALSTLDLDALRADLMKNDTKGAQSK